MATTTLLEDAMDIVSKMKPQEHLQLIERVASSLEQELKPAIEPDPHWGQKVVDLINSLDMSEWEALPIEDSLDWVKSLREQEAARLDKYWKAVV